MGVGKGRMQVDYRAQLAMGGMLKGHTLILVFGRRYF